MRIAIVEDDRGDADTLSALLEKYGQNHSLELCINYFRSGEDFLGEESFKKYHLAFLDIYMGEGMDGIETARRLQERQKDCLIVFLTVSREDIWRAVGMHACFDYVEKSALDDVRLERLLGDVRRRLRLEAKVLEFYSGKQKVRLPLSKIQFLVSRDKYIMVMLEDGREMRYRATFSSLSAMLEGERCFLLCNRGVLLNMDYIRKVNPETFEMSGGALLPIRRSNHGEIMKRYRDYQFEKLSEQEV